MQKGSSSASRATLFRISPSQALSVSLLLLGTVVYHFLERWSWVDSFYASTGVLTTVGIVMVPHTARGRWFTSLLNVASLGVAGLWISEVSEGRRSWARRVFRLGSMQPTPTQDVLVHAALVVPPLLAASTAFAYLEGWGAWDSLYFTLTCSTGLGMGDVEPLQPTSRLLFSLYLLWVMGSAMDCLHALGVILASTATKPLHALRLTTKSVDNDQ